MTDQNNQHHPKSAPEGRHFKESPDRSYKPRTRKVEKEAEPLWNRGTVKHTSHEPSEPHEPVEDIKQARKHIQFKKPSLFTPAGDKPGRKTTDAYAMATAGFCTVLLAAFGLFVALPDSTYSSAENRALTQFPTLTWDAFFQGRSQNDLQNYVEDQFPGRSVFVSLKVGADSAEGKIESNGVFNGKDNYLIRDFSGPLADGSSKADQAVEKFTSAYSELNNTILIAPTAVSVMADKLPLFAQPGDENEYLDTLYGQLEENGSSVVDVREAFASSVAEGNQLYYRTDHHWTTDGAYLAFQQAAQSLDVPADSIKYDSIVVDDAFNGSLTSKSGYLANELDSIVVYIPTNRMSDIVVTYVEDQTLTSTLYDVASLDGADPYEVFTGGNHPEIKVQSLADNDRVLLVFKDSYANSLVPFVAPVFSKTIIIDPRYWYGDVDNLIETEGVTDTLFCYNAETFSNDTSLQTLFSDLDDQAAENVTQGTPDESTPQ